MMAALVEITPDVEERFWAKVDKRGDDECWGWKGAAVRDGRGRMWYMGTDTMATHIALTLAGKPRPDPKAYACHSCDNPACVNPAHLWWGDHFTNMQDCASKGRLGGQRKTHCKWGHPYTPENTIRQGAGRKCRACCAIHSHRYDAKPENRERKILRQRLRRRAAKARIDALSKQDTKQGEGK